MKRVLVTGATGFVAAAAIPELQSAGWEVTAALRNDADAWRAPAGCRPVVVGDIGPRTDWTAALAGATAVVHLAARVHQGREGRAAEQAHHETNTLGTRTLAEAAARAGVTRFVHLSSVKAMGASTPPGRPWTEQSDCRPVDAYGRSKLAAERALAQVAASSGLPVCVLRPPLVYGPGAKANVARLLRAVAAGRPLPLGGVANRRSLIFVGNLASAIVCAADHPRAVGVFLVRDGEDLSTAELARRLGGILNRPARLVPVPVGAVRRLARAVGGGRVADRLFGDLTVDDTLWRRTSGWEPPYSVSSGLALTAASVYRSPSSSPERA